MSALQWPTLEALVGMDGTRWLSKLELSTERRASPARTSSALGKQVEHSSPPCFEAASGNVNMYQTSP